MTDMIQARHFYLNSCKNAQFSLRESKLCNYVFSPENIRSKMINMKWSCQQHLRILNYFSMIKAQSANITWFWGSSCLWRWGFGRCLNRDIWSSSTSSWGRSAITKTWASTRVPRCCDFIAFQKASPLERKLPDLICKFYSHNKKYLITWSRKFLSRLVPKTQKLQPLNLKKKILRCHLFFFPSHFRSFFPTLFSWFVKLHASLNICCKALKRLTLSDLLFYLYVVTLSKILF